MTFDLSLRRRRRRLIKRAIERIDFPLERIDFTRRDRQDPAFGVINVRMSDASYGYSWIWPHTWRIEFPKSWPGIWRDQSPDGSTFHAQAAFAHELGHVVAWGYMSDAMKRQLFEAMGSAWNAQSWDGMHDACTGFIRAFSDLYPFAGEHITLEMCRDVRRILNVTPLDPPWAR